MSLQPTGVNINLAQTQRPLTNNPTLSSGTTAGTVFDGRGNDFLDPDRVLRNVDGFSSSISPVSSKTLTSRISPADPFGDNPTSDTVLGRTNSTLNRILSPSFGTNLNFTIPLIPLPSGNSIPDLGTNPDPTKITLFTDFFAQAIQPSVGETNVSNFNPLVWSNPNSTNILLGVTNAQSNVLNGTGLSSPAFNPFPDQATLNFPFNPFGSSGSTIQSLNAGNAIGSIGSAGSQTSNNQTAATAMLSQMAVLLNQMMQAAFGTSSGTGTAYF
jgi:hypothetical protein